MVGEHGTLMGAYSTFYSVYWLGPPLNSLCREHPCSSYPEADLDNSSSTFPHVLWVCLSSKGWKLSPHTHVLSKCMHTFTQIKKQNNNWHWHTKIQSETVISMVNQSNLVILIIGCVAWDTSEVLEESCNQNHRQQGAVMKWHSTCAVNMKAWNCKFMTLECRVRGQS